MTTVFYSKDWIGLDWVRFSADAQNLFNFFSRFESTFIPLSTEKKQ